MNLFKWMLGLILCLNLNCKMNEITTEAKNGKGIESKLEISNHNHLHFDKNYSINDVLDFMMNDGVDIAMITGYEMPDIVSKSYSDIVEKITKNSMFSELKGEYEIGFVDSFAMKIVNKEKKKSVYLINSLEVGTQEDAHVELIGYNGNITHNLSLDETIQRGLDEGAIVVVCHPCNDEGKIMSKALNPFSQAYLINDEREELLEVVSFKYAGKLCFEEFNAFLGRLLWISMKGGNKKTKEFIEDFNECGVKIKKVNGNDSHIKDISSIYTMGQVYWEMFSTDIDTTSGETLRESIKHNLSSGNYALSPEKYISGWEIWKGFGPDKIKSIKNKILGRKRIGEK